MNPEEKQHFEDLIIKAVQSGKKETSDLVDSILHRIEPVVAKAIETHVNGKIRAIDAKIDAYIVDDNKWKTLAMPVIEMGKNVQGFGKVSLYILGFIASVSAGFYALMAFMKKN